MNLNDLLDQPLEVQKERDWSVQQQAAFEAVKEAEQPLILDAAAGAGKSTTLVEMTHHAPGSKIHLCFNKSAQMELEAKLQGIAAARTLNALGFAVCRENILGAVKMEFKKSQILLKDVMNDQDFKDFGYTCSRIIGLAKNCAFGIGDITDGDFAFEALINAYQMDIPADRISDFAIICSDVFKLSREKLNLLDFDDQLYLPIFHQWKFPHYDNAFIDECQDLSTIQHKMTEQLFLEGARIVAVGDPNQAIYGFRGASTNSMAEMKELFGMKELPLSVTYRCAQSIVKVAQEFKPSIGARPGAPLGRVFYASDSKEGNPQIFKDCLIVCRTNAPLFACILRHVRAGEPCQVLSSFIDTLQSFLRSFKCRETTALQKKLDVWFDKEATIARSKGQRGKLAGLQDKYDTVTLLCGRYFLVEEVINLIKSLSESRRGPLFSTIHKAKGLEHEHCFILRPDLMPAKWDNSPEAQQQEANMEYVAITRAKNILTWGEGR